MLREKLDSDLKAAMLSQHTSRVRTLRSIRAALQQKEIEKRGTGESALSDDEVVGVLQKQAKQRKDSIEQYARAGRDDLEAVEVEELAIIEEYLPRQASDEEILSVVKDVIREVGAASMADVGRVMGKAMSVLRGKADGRRINELVKKSLSETD
jgi:uncharacterized protein YqeY